VPDPTARRKQTAKEYFDIGRDNCSRVSNVWFPEQVLPGFRDAAPAFFNTCHRFELQKLLPALSLGLGLPGEGEFLGNTHREGENQMRLLHYPAVPAESKMNRIDAHTVRNFLSSGRTRSCDKEGIGLWNMRDVISR